MKGRYGQRWGGELSFSENYICIFITQNKNMGSYIMKALRLYIFI